MSLDMPRFGSEDLESHREP